MTGNGERSGHQQALEAGTRFAGLTVSHVLGYGNFGITYKALDDLGQVFVVKEFFPVGLVMRDVTDAVVPISPEKAEAFEAGKHADARKHLDHAAYTPIGQLTSALLTGWSWAAEGRMEKAIRALKKTIQKKAREDRRAQAETWVDPHLPEKEQYGVRLMSMKLALPSIAYVNCCA